MFKFLFVSLSFVFLIHSCTPENRLYSERQELSPNLEWVGSDVKTFKFSTKEADLNYTVNFELRFVTGYPFKTLNVLADIISPSGEVIQKEYTLKIKDDEGNYIGEAGMDLWDSKHLVDTQLNLQEIGEYTIKLTHNMAMDPLPYVMELGVIIDKNK
jgi:gliding motility-associated lipoprotein GldH